MKYKQILLGILICVATEFLLYGINHHYHLFKPIFVRAIPEGYEKHEGGGHFTNPLLECLGLEGDDSFDQLNVSVDSLQEFIDQIKKTSGLENISVYLRDLNNGPWVGINQSEKFIGGSLLKVPTLISYLKLAESDPAILKKVIEYKEEAVSNHQYFASAKQIQVGNSYTIQELLEYMIYYSDNNAAYLLSKNIDIKEFDKIFVAMGLGDPDPDKPYPVDTKTYAGFFRILFNASYLSRDSSEKALDILSHVEFNRGIQAQLPKDIVVSHKFGIRSDGGVNQLHDCGVVYYPGHPYLLCIMTRGEKDFDSEVSVISQISKFIFDRVSEDKK